MSTAIIGAGMAGLACATQLGGAAAGVQLFDKARGPGGRMSTRRVEVAGRDVGFDHGAQYFTVRDAGFSAEVARWAAAGAAAPWPAAGPDAWVGTPGMNAPVRLLAAAQRVSWGARVVQLTADAGGWRLTLDRQDGSLRFAQVVVALPAEQAHALLAPVAPALAELAASAPSEPCWAVMAAFADPLPLPDTLRDRGAIGWAARNGAKPGRTGGETWVIQGAPDWSRAHLEADATAVTALLLAELAALAGRALPAPLHVAAHRWRYARSGNVERAAVWDGERRIGVCGDWLAGPRVESAYCSGARLAALMLERAL